MLQSNSLRALLTPSAAALVGASSKPGSIGRIALENLLAGGFQGSLYVVNPAHKHVLAQRCYPSLAAIGKPVDVAVIAAPMASVPAILNDAGRAGVKAAIVLSPFSVESGDAKSELANLRKVSKAHGIRVLGPHSFGLIRTDLGLNATVGATAAHAGKLALVSQSGAVCAAMLDFAASAGIGFSTVVALGSAIDVGVGEILDALAVDTETDGVLLYVEAVGDARRFLSALRAAARAKPVVVFKAGRSKERGAPGAPSPDMVFDAAMERTGSVRVKTYTQLLATARVLAMHRASHGERLAIVTNGIGPGTIAADSATDRGVPLAGLSDDTRSRLAALMPTYAGQNPINVDDCTASTLAAAVDATLQDEGVDATLVLHVPRPATGATDAARAVADVARKAKKPVLSVWLGAVNRREASDALEAGGIANFYTPENAIEAFSFLALYRRHQRWLLEVPSPQPEPQPPNYSALERIRNDAAARDRCELTEIEAHALLSEFGIPVPPSLATETLAEAAAAARKLGYPVTLRLDQPVDLLSTRSVPSRRRLRDGRMLGRAWAALAGSSKARRRAAFVVRKETLFNSGAEFSIGVRQDAVFGPVITLGACGASATSDRAAVLLPPLNASLAHDLIHGSRIAAGFHELEDSSVIERIAAILVQVSALVCALPWVQTMTLDPIRVGSDGAEILGMHIAIDPRGKPAGLDYRHMAIHPYPIEMVEDVTLASGERLHVRPIRPEDAELERAFVHGLSDQSRYFRFFYQLHELPPSMLARFTQVDYDREMAIIAVDESVGARAIVGVARYIMSPDKDAAEFAIVVTDAWQGRGVARMLMARLIRSAKARGLTRIEGTVLRTNHTMLKFAEALGFKARDNLDDPEQISIVRDLP